MVDVWQGQMAERKSWIPEISKTDLVVDKTPDGLLKQTRTTKLRRATFCGTPIVVHTLRTTALQSRLQDATLAALQDADTSWLHPNLVQVLGATANGDCVVTEYTPLSLYDVLHRDRMVLSRREIALIARQVVKTLSFLHERQEPFGVVLTSKKVMLQGGPTILKLRRFGDDLVCSRAGVSHDHTTHHVMQRELESIGEETTATIDQRKDLYAFGILLLEMCTREAPSVESFNQISCAAQLDPVFEQIIRVAIQPDVNIPDIKSHLPEAAAITARHLLSILDENEERQQQMESLKLSSASFLSFLHVDRYFQEQESQQVERKLEGYDRHCQVALKRLASVEQELVEEQTNFSVLVKQIEQLQQHSAQQELSIRRFRLHVSTLAQVNQRAESREDTLMHSIVTQQRLIEELQLSIAFQKTQCDRLQTEKEAEYEERQKCMQEALRITDDKENVLHQLREMECQNSVLAGKVGGEREAMEDLEARLKQAIYRWEQEQVGRRVMEKQMQALSCQLVQLEEERSNYTLALRHSPTGELDPKSANDYVLQLKDTEIATLKDSVHLGLHKMNEMAQHAREQEVTIQTHETKIRDCQDEIFALQEQKRDLNAEIEVLRRELDQNQKRYEITVVDINALNGKIKSLEEEVDQQIQQREEQDRARRMRQCLTPNCDAPRFLVGPTGYCAECVEKQRRENPLPSKSTRARNHSRVDSGIPTSCQNAQNAPVIECIRAIEHDRTAEAEETVDTVLQLLGHMKQLTALVKGNEALKDDLPECKVLKTIPSIMKEHHASLALQLEGCKCLSTIVFNHDRNRIILVAEGIVEIILRACSQFQAEPKVHEAACVLLTNLSHNSESNRARIVSVGGIEAVLQGMQTFPRHQGVQKRSCWALLTLAGSDAMCDEIAARGGFGAVIAAMLNCPSDAHVQHYGSWALLNLVSGTSRLQDFARREGVVEVAEAALACFPDHDEIQDKAQQILRLIHV